MVNVKLPTILAQTRRWRSSMQSKDPVYTAHREAALRAAEANDAAQDTDDFDPMHSTDHLPSDNSEAQDSAQGASAAESLPAPLLNEKYAALSSYTRPPLRASNTGESNTFQHASHDGRNEEWASAPNGSLPDDENTGTPFPASSLNVGDPSSSSALAANGAVHSAHGKPNVGANQFLRAAEPSESPLEAPSMSHQGSSWDMRSSPKMQQETNLPIEGDPAPEHATSAQPTRSLRALSSNNPFRNEAFVNAYLNAEPPQPSRSATPELLESAHVPPDTPPRPPSSAHNNLASHNARLFVPRSSTPEHIPPGASPGRSAGGAPMSDGRSSTSDFVDARASSPESSPVAQPQAIFDGTSFSTAVDRDTHPELRDWLDISDRLGDAPRVPVTQDPPENASAPSENVLDEATFTQAINEAILQGTIHVEPLAHRRSESGAHLRSAYRLAEDASQNPAEKAGEPHDQSSAHAPTPMHDNSPSEPKSPPRETPAEMLPSLVLPDEPSRDDFPPDVSADLHPDANEEGDAPYDAPPASDIEADIRTMEMESYTRHRAMSLEQALTELPPPSSLDDLGMEVVPLMKPVTTSRSSSYRILCGTVLANKYLLLGTTNGLEALPIDLAGSATRKPTTLLKRTRFEHLVVLENRTGLLLGVCGRSRSVRVYPLSWIMHLIEKRNPRSSKSYLPNPFLMSDVNGDQDDPLGASSLLSVPSSSMLSRISSQIRRKRSGQHDTLFADNESQQPLREPSPSKRSSTIADLSLGHPSSSPNAQPALAVPSANASTRLPSISSIVKNTISRRPSALSTTSESHVLYPTSPSEQTPTHTNEASERKTTSTPSMWLPQDLPPINDPSLPCATFNPGSSTLMASSAALVSDGVEVITQSVPVPPLFSPADFVKLARTRRTRILRTAETANRTYVAVLCGENADRVELFSGRDNVALSLDRTFVLPESPKSIEFQLQSDDLVDIYLIYSNSIFALEPTTVRVRVVNIGRGDRRLRRMRYRILDYDFPLTASTSWPVPRPHERVSPPNNPVPSNSHSHAPNRRPPPRSASDLAAPGDTSSNPFLARPPSEVQARTRARAQAKARARSRARLPGHRVESNVPHEPDSTNSLSTLSPNVPRTTSPANVSPTNEAPRSPRLAPSSPVAAGAPGHTVPTEEQTPNAAAAESSSPEDSGDEEAIPQNEAAPRNLTEVSIDPATAQAAFQVDQDDADDATSPRRASMPPAPSPLVASESQPFPPLQSPSRPPRRPASALNARARPTSAASDTDDMLPRTSTASSLGVPLRAAVFPPVDPTPAAALEALVEAEDNNGDDDIFRPPTSFADRIRQRVRQSDRNALSNEVTNAGAPSIPSETPRAPQEPPRRHSSTRRSHSQRDPQAPGLHMSGLSMPYSSFTQLNNVPYLPPSLLSSSWLIPPKYEDASHLTDHELKPVSLLEVVSSQETQNPGLFIVSRGGHVSGIVTGDGRWVIKKPMLWSSSTSDDLGASAPSALLSVQFLSVPDKPFPVVASLGPYGVKATTISESSSGKSYFFPPVNATACSGESRIVPLGSVPNHVFFLETNASSISLYDLRPKAL